MSHWIISEREVGYFPRIKMNCFRLINATLFIYLFFIGLYSQHNLPRFKVVKLNILKVDRFSSACRDSLSALAVDSVSGVLLT